MSAAASLSNDHLGVEPGGETSVSVTVRNTGTVVDELTVVVVGDAADWAVVEPPSVSLLPGDSETVTVHFRPPRSPAVAAGELPFAVKVAPHEQPDLSTVEEGVLDLAPFSELTAELVPRTSRGRKQGRHQLAIDNRGNTPVDLRLSAADADRLLLFKIDPPSTGLGAGRATFANLTVAPRKRFWRGAAKTLPFQVLVEPIGDAAVPLAVDATFVQEPRLPKWLPKALLALLLLVAGLVALWYLLLRPVIESVAREAAEEEVAEELAEITDDQAEVAAQAAQAEQTAVAAEEAAVVAQEAADVASEQAINVAAQADQAQQIFAGQDLGDPIDFRLGNAVAPGAESSESFTVADDATLALTDIVLQNPQGDEGLLQVRRAADGQTSTLLETRLENFRDLDYHFVSPVFFGPGQAVSVFVSCEESTADECAASAYLSGFEGEVEEEATEGATEGAIPPEG